MTHGPQGLAGKRRSWAPAIAQAAICKFKRQRAVGERLGDMDARHRLRRVEIGQRARQLQHAVVAARGELHGGRRVLQEPHAGALRRRHGLDEIGAGLGVAAHFCEPRIALPLDGAGGGDALRHRARSSR